MIDGFTMNGIYWKVISVHPMSNQLVDRTGTRTVAVTDWLSKTIYVSCNISGEFKKRVIAHEMGHAVCFSYNLLSEIHECCYPSKRIQMEEFICNFVADYGEMIFQITYRLLGDMALEILPYHLEQMVS